MCVVLTTAASNRIIPELLLLHGRRRRRLLLLVGVQFLFVLHLSHSDVRNIVFGGEPGQFALVEIGLVVHSAALELLGPYGNHLQAGLFQVMVDGLFRRDGGTGRRRRSCGTTAAVFVYLVQRVHELFALRLGRRRGRGRRRLLLGGRLRRGYGIGGGGGARVRGLRGWPDGRGHFLRPGVELLGGMLRRDGGSTEELFFLFEALLYPGHDDGVVGRRRCGVVVLMMVVIGRRRQRVIGGRGRLEQRVATRHADVHAVPAGRVDVRGRRLLVAVVQVAATRAAVRLGGGRPPGAGCPVRRHESSRGRRLHAAAATVSSAEMMIPDVLVDRAGIATAVETQLAARCHSRFQTAGSLVGLGIVSSFAEVLYENNDQTAVY